MGWDAYELFKVGESGTLFKTFMEAIAAMAAPS